MSTFPELPLLFESLVCKSLKCFIISFNLGSFLRSPVDSKAYKIHVTIKIVQKKHPLMVEKKIIHMIMYLDKMSNGNTINGICFFTAKYFKQHVFNICKIMGFNIPEKKIQISSDNFSKLKKNSALYAFQKLSLFNLSYLWYDFFLFGSIFRLC